MSIAMAVPRIRGRVGTGDDGKFYFEVSVWNFEGTAQVGDPIGPFGPWESEKEAQAELRKAVEIGVKGFCPDATGYVDFKNGGVFRNFKSDEH